MCATSPDRVRGVHCMQRTSFSKKGGRENHSLPPQTPTMLFVPTNPSCLRTNIAGWKYEELSCVYPAWGKTFFGFELNYDPVPVRDSMVANPWVPIAAVLLYGIGIVVGRKYFEKRGPWSWRNTLAFWNLSLSLFSLCGFLRTSAQLAHNLTSYDLASNICLDPESTMGSGTSGLWVQLFVLSKFPELIDTFFIVIHKKPLIFLHWYHHVTVLLYCWHAYVTKAPTGLFFIVMNYGVHSIMYGYYFLMAMKLKPSWMNAMVITVAQISQMIVGVIVTALGFYYAAQAKANNQKCLTEPRNNFAALIMYGSYLFLFMEFFLARYFGIKRTTGLKEKKKAA